MSQSSKPLKPDQFKAALEDYEQAYQFTLKTHKTDLERIDSLNGLMTDFDQFFYEYVYVVCASGFKAQHAARMTPLLVKCNGDIDKMRAIFKNERKISAIEKMYKNKSKWDTFRLTLTSVDALSELPFIGGITKYHLARNIGLLSTAKPDLHLCRWVGEITGNDSEENVGKVVGEIAQKVNRKPGSVDFAIWVWLSHDRGSEKPCCHGGYALR